MNGVGCGCGWRVRTTGEFPGISRFNEVRRAEWPEHGGGIIRAGDLKFSPTLFSDPRLCDWGMSRVNNMLIRTVLPSRSRSEPPLRILFLSLLAPAFSSFYFFSYLFFSPSLSSPRLSLISRKANACYSGWKKEGTRYRLWICSCNCCSSSFRFRTLWFEITTWSFDF